MIEIDREDVFTEREAAEILKMTPRMLATRRRAGKIRCIKDGHFIVYKVEHFAEYLCSLEKGTRLETYLTDTSDLLEAVKRHLALSTRRRKV